MREGRLQGNIMVTSLLIPWWMRGRGGRRREGEGRPSWGEGGREREGTYLVDEGEGLHTHNLFFYKVTSRNNFNGNFSSIFLLRPSIHYTVGTSEQL
jgi:hypothetical protein